VAQLWVVRRESDIVRHMKRKHWIGGGLIVLLLILVCARVSMAKSHMDQQVERLARIGYPGYTICECDYLRYSDDGRYLCIRVKAQRIGDPHIIQIDFPWNPFETPQHRI